MDARLLGAARVLLYLIVEKMFFEREIGNARLLGT